MQTPGQSEPVHPRLYFRAGDVEALKQKASLDPLASAAWKRIEKGATAAMARALPQWSSRWEHDSGAIGQVNLGLMTSVACQDVSNLAFSFLLRGNKRHARRAADIMLAICDFPFWVSPIFFNRTEGIPWRGTLAGEPVPQTTVLREAGWTAATVDRGKRRDVIGLRVEGAGPGPVHQIRTDATLFALTLGDGGRPESAVIEDGSFLEWHGTRLLSWDARGNRAVDLG